MALTSAGCVCDRSLSRQGIVYLRFCIAFSFCSVSLYSLGLIDDHRRCPHDENDVCSEEEVQLYIEHRGIVCRQLDQDTSSSRII